MLLHQDVLSRLMGLPDGMTAFIKVAQLAQAEILERAMTKKDIMLERIGSPESELDLLRTQADMLLQATDTAPSFSAIWPARDVRR